MSRRLDDRIRDLCANVVAADEPELEPKISELKSALREHTARLRKMVATKIAGLKDQPEERRSHNDRRSQSTPQS
jgi:hypothetical protein